MKDWKRIFGSVALGVLLAGSSWGIVGCGASSEESPSTDAQKAALVGFLQELVTGEAGDSASLRAALETGGSHVIDVSGSVTTEDCGDDPACTTRIIYSGFRVTHTFSNFNSTGCTEGFQLTGEIVCETSGTLLRNTVTGVETWEELDAFCETPLAPAETLDVIFDNSTPDEPEDDVDSTMSIDLYLPIAYSGPQDGVLEAMDGLVTMNDYLYPADELVGFLAGGCLEP